MYFMIYFMHNFSTNKGKKVAILTIYLVRNEYLSNDLKWVQLQFNGFLFLFFFGIIYIQGVPQNVYKMDMLSPRNTTYKK